MTSLVPILMGFIIVLFLLQGAQGISPSEMVGAVISAPFVALSHALGAMGAGSGGIVLAVVTIALLAFGAQMAFAFVGLESVVLVAVFLFVLTLVM